MIPVKWPGDDEVHLMRSVISDSVYLYCGKNHPYQDTRPAGPVDGPLCRKCLASAQEEERIKGAKA